MKPLSKLNAKRKGQTLVEYALILVLVSIIATAALRAIFGKGAAPYRKVASEGFDGETP